MLGGRLGSRARRRRNLCDEKRVCAAEDRNRYRGIRSIHTQHPETRP